MSRRTMQIFEGLYLLGIAMLFFGPIAIFSVTPPAGSDSFRWRMFFLLLAGRIAYLALLTVIVRAWNRLARRES